MTDSPVAAEIMELSAGVTLGHPASVGSAIVRLFVNFARAGNRCLCFPTKVVFKPAESAETSAKADHDDTSFSRTSTTDGCKSRLNNPRDAAVDAMFRKLYARNLTLQSRAMLEKSRLWRVKLRRGR